MTIQHPVKPKWKWLPVHITIIKKTDLQVTIKKQIKPTTTIFLDVYDSGITSCHGR